MLLEALCLALWGYKDKFGFQFPTIQAQGGGAGTPNQNHKNTQQQKAILFFFLKHVLNIKRHLQLKMQR